MPEDSSMTTAGTDRRLDRRFSIAPMMDCSDRHARYFLRLFSPRILLYTEMVTAAAIVHGDRDHLLESNPEEHPLAVQLGGSDPEQLAQAAHACIGYGYDEINLNCGCPSDRVQSGQFVLAAEPVGTMKSAPGRRSGANSPRLYVEFRKDGRPINPRPWWSASSKQKVQG